MKTRELKVAEFNARPHCLKEVDDKQAELVKAILVDLLERTKIKS